MSKLVVYRGLPLAPAFVAPVRPPALPSVRGRDRSLQLAMLMTAAVGLIALVWSYHNNLLLAYNDAVSHLYIARRVLDTRTPGLAQLGTNWLPVPHLLLQPFVYNDYLWYSGLAGSIVGFLCFEITAIALFLSVRLIARHEAAAWLGLAAFVSNPNAFYLQTTAMTEPVLLMTMTVSGYFLLRWSKGDRYGDLLLAGLVGSLAVGSRYDGWFFVGVCVVLAALRVQLRWRERARTEGLALAYLGLPIYAMFLWLLYNWLIFGDPLAFQRGEFSSQQVVAQGPLPAKHNLLLSIQTYSWAVLDTLGGVVVVLALVGLVIYVLHTRLRLDSLVPYAFLSPYLFNVISLWLGQTTLSTPQTDPPGYLNVRYALMLLPGVALFIGYLADALMARARAGWIALALLLVLAVQGALWVPDWPHSIVTLQDGLLNDRTALVLPAQYVRAHYQGGGLLIDDAYHAPFIAETHIALHEYLVNGQAWQRALHDPAPYVAWVITQSGDKVATALLGKPNPAFQHRFHRVLTSGDFAIYQRVDG